MKTAVITVLFHTPESEVKRLEKEINDIGFSEYRLFCIDNTSTGKGFAQGVNEGIREGLKEGCDLFMVVNPDISVKGLQAGGLLAASEHFDVWGLAMEQDGKVYYGGEIEKWRMSGGLMEKKPSKRFQDADYVTGSLMFIKRKVVEEIGGLEEDYFMYYEDVDYCERARRSGFRIGIDTQLQYEHFESSKSYEGKKYQLAKNRLLFLLKFGSWKQKIREFIRSPKTVIEERVLIQTTLRSTFLKSFLSLNASGFISKGLNFLLFLALIRHIPISDYGIYTLVWAHVTLLAPLVDFGTTSYGLVYLPQEKHKRFSSLYSMRIFLAAAVFILTLFSGFMFRYSGRVFFYIFLTSFVIFYNTVTGMFLIISSIDNKLVANSVIAIVTNVIMIFVIILGVLTTSSLTVVFYLLAFFYLLYTLYYAYLVKKSISHLRLTLQIRDWLNIAKKSYIFVLISLFAGIYFKVDVFILNLLKGTTAVGTYSSGYKFFEATILLASSYNTLAAPILSRTAHHNRQKLKVILAKHFLFLAAVGVVVVIVTQLFGSWFLPVILKGNYGQAIDVVKIVIWALPFILLNSVFFNLLYAVKLSHIVVYIFIGMSIINFVANLLLIPRFSFFASSYLTVASEIINFVLLSFLVFIIFRKKVFHD